MKDVKVIISCNSTSKFELDLGVAHPLSDPQLISKYFSETPTGEGPLKRIYMREANLESFIQESDAWIRIPPTFKAGFCFITYDDLVASGYFDENTE